jgi:AcrR family transcriptional regulator
MAPSPSGRGACTIAADVPGSPTSGPPRARARRRDAEQNRETILAAARAAFAERGVSAGVDQIARRAGVGPATLYRHFPSKAALVDAVLEEGVRTFVEVVRRAGEVPDPAGALRELVHRVVDQQIADRSFRDLVAWHDAASTEDVPAMSELGDALLAVVARARDSGTLRADATFADVMLVLLALDGLSGAAGETSPEAVHRVADIAVDGLMEVSERLDGAPLALEELRVVTAAGTVLPPRASAN